jgi:hypothetical protein
VRDHLRVVLLLDIAFMQFCCEILHSCDFTMRYRLCAISCMRNGLVLISFLSDVFLMSPFTFFGDASSFIKGIFNEPLCVFYYASFFIGGLFNEPLYVFWKCLFFHRRSFWRAPLRFGGCLFFSSDVFLISPSVFLMLFFHQRSF